MKIAGVNETDPGCHLNFVIPPTEPSLSVRKKLLRTFPRSGMVDTELEDYYQLLGMRQKI